MRNESSSSNTHQYSIYTPKNNTSTNKKRHSTAYHYHHLSNIQCIHIRNRISFHSLQIHYPPPHKNNNNNSSSNTKCQTKKIINKKQHQSYISHFAFICDARDFFLQKKTCQHRIFPRNNQSHPFTLILVHTSTHTHTH